MHDTSSDREWERMRERMGWPAPPPPPPRPPGRGRPLVAAAVLLVGALACEALGWALWLGLLLALLKGTRIVP